MDIGTARALLAPTGGSTGLFAYSGRFLDEHSSRLIELGELLRFPDGDAVFSKGRLGYVMVEAYQNVIRHRTIVGSGNTWGPERCLFLLHTGRGGQRLCTLNPVTVQQAARLGEILEALAGRDAAGLKQLYLEGIQRSRSPEQRGAGLGLIEMVRRSGQPPQWDFAPLDEDHQLFSFTLRSGQALPEEGGDLHRLIREQRIQLVHAGHWSTALGKVLVGMAQVEVPSRPGRSADRESVWGLVSSVVLPLLQDRPVLFALHGSDQPIVSVGGTLPAREAGGFHAAMQGTDVEFSFGDTAEEDQVLALVHVPW